MDKKKLYTLFIGCLITGLMLSIFVTANNKRLAESAPKDTEISQTQENQTEFDAIIYYGISCSFCKDVDQWIEENNVDDYLTIDHREVSQNIVNSKQLIQTANDCGLDTKQIGVPFMFAQGQCFSGKVEIIDYLSNTIAAYKDQQTQTNTQDLVDE